MPDNEKPVGEAPPEVVPERATDRDAPPRRGLGSQPLALRILLIASLTALAAGIVRCSIELTSEAPPIASIGVARAIVDLDEGTAWAPADSISFRAARTFAGALRNESDVDVRLAPRTASGFDAVARIRIDEADAGIRVAVGIVDGSSGRPLFETGAEGEPAMLEGLLSGAALQVARALGVTPDDEGDAERIDREPGAP